MESANETKTKSTPIRIDILDEGGEILQTCEFVKEKIVLGRILSADVRIDDPRVSRIHALVEVRGDSILITDLASSHGTFLRNQKIIESKINFGDTFKLGFVECRLQKGSGQVTSHGAFEGTPIHEGEATQVEIDRSKLDKRGPDRRRKEALPSENRMDDRRDGERRVEQRQGERRAPQKGEVKLPAGVDKDRRSGVDRRDDKDYERRLGERRRNDRRIFDITSLERRIEERRTRRGEDDLLPEELEKAFTTPAHARELEVTALWGDHILDVSNYHEAIVLSAGEAPQNHYIIPSEGIPEEFPLITIEEDGNAYLAFTDRMSGTVRARDKIYKLSELQDEKFIKQMGDYFLLGLKQDDFAKIQIGTVNFFMLYVKPAPRVKAAPLLDKDPLLMRTTIGSLLFLLIMMVGMSFVQPPKPVTIEMIPERFAKIVIKQRPNIPKAGIVAKGEESKEGGSVMGEGGAAKGPEGEAGKPELPKKAEKAQVVAPQSKPKDAAAQAPQKPQPTPQQRKVVDMQKAKSVGLLKAFSQSGMQKDLKNLVDGGVGAPGQGGFDDFGKAVSGLRGKSIEETGGAGGKGLKGVDAGGGGKTIGIDGPSTKGLGRGSYGDGIGEGISGPGRLGIKGEHAISIISENVQVLSGLPKDVINAVVQRHRAEIRACYDAALQRNPNIRGKIVVAFTIQPNGVVSATSVKESALGDGGLEGCILSRIRTWLFPKPEAPVVTEVAAYPFYLNPAN